MQIIHPGRQDIQKALAVPDVKSSTILHRSAFLLCKTVENGTLVCSTLTGGLFLLSGREFEFLTGLPGNGADMPPELIPHRLVTGDPAKEAVTADQLRALLLRRQTAKKAYVSYNILPTTYCNAHCFYCYESAVRHVHMSEKTAEQLIQFIVSHHRGHQVALNWFGGEPLLGYERICQICSRLREQDVGFVSRMTSNAFLFDEEMVLQAKELWNLRNIQVTLDGTEEIYNRTKAFAAVQDNPYRRVLRNIRLLVNAGIHVDIRLNFDSHNQDNLMALTDELAGMFDQDNNISVYAEKLNAGAGFAPIEHTDRETALLDQRFMLIREKLEQNGWPQCREEKLPSLRAASCMADNPLAIQCTPDGILSKCEDQIYGHTVGTLSDGITDAEQIGYWQQRRIFDGCGQCPLYPSCDRLLRNCPVKTTKCSEYDREHRIARYHEIMRQEYEKWKNTEQ